MGWSVNSKRADGVWVMAGRASKADRLAARSGGAAVRHGARARARSTIARPSPNSGRLSIDHRCSIAGQSHTADTLPDLSVLQVSKHCPPSLPLEVFGDGWAGWIKDAAEAAACPVDYVVAALLPAASALIGHARWAQAWPGWQEPPHLWCAAVGHSGQGKSPGADLILRHVVPAIEARMMRDIGFKEDLELAMWRAQAAAIAANDAAFPSPLAGAFIEPRFMESDLTIEKVAEVLSRAAPKGLLMVRDELAGWLFGMNRFNPGARAFWLEAYGGRPYSLDRVKSSGRIYVPRLAVAWHGGVQPSRLAKLMADADDGLLARFSWFWPKPIPFRRPRSAPNIAFAISAFERLSLLALGPATALSPQDLDFNREPAGPIIVPLTDDAAAELEAFAQQMQDHQSHSTGLMTSALGKARGLVLRLSLVLQYLRWAAEDGMAPAPAEVGTDALQSAIRLATEYLMPMAQRVYADAASLPHDRAVETLARWIIQSKATEVYVRDLQRHQRLRGLTTAVDIHTACRTLVKAGWLVPPPPGSNNGRAKQAYKVRSGVWRSL